MTLLTIGYEGRTIDDFVALLIAHSVDVLIDVRLNPISRKPGFSKRKLEARLAVAGIGYQHLRALGNPKEIRDLARTTEESLARYARHMAPTWPEALAPLETILAGGQRPCLLCMERDPASCHRSVVVAQLERRHPDLTLHHIV